jgi:type I restriction enzyme, S subunit
LKSNPKIIRLDDIAEINPVRKVVKGSLVPFINMAALSENSRDIDKDSIDQKIAKGGGSHFKNFDTLLARITPCLENGKTANVKCLADNIVGEGSTEFIVLCGLESADNDYIYYLCRDPEFRKYAINRMEGTSGRQRVSWQSIASYKFPCPEAKIRHSNAKILSLLDNRITALRETNITLEAIAQALFKSWFVDFDPVRAKQEGRKPEGMDEVTAALFPDRFEQSKLGEAPKGWQIKELKDILYLLGGQAFKSKEYISQGIFVLRTNNFKQGIAIKNDNDVFLPNSFLDSYKNFVCEAYDYHLVMVGASIGNTGMILPHLLPALRNQNMWCFRPKNQEVTSRLYTKFIVDKTSQELINFASGSARDFFKRDDFKNHKLIIPPEKILKSYSKITNPFLEKISVNYNKIEILNNLRDILLPKLISGKLRLSDEELITSKTKVTA